MGGEAAGRGREGDTTTVSGREGGTDVAVVMEGATKIREQEQHRVHR
jgi:hypothetical protein